MIESSLFTPYPEVVGVFVGGCVERGVGSSFRAQAHAHTSGEHKGWICVRSQKRLLTARGGLSQLMLHEIAHILVMQGHTDAWRAKCRELGYRLPARYKKKKRGPARGYRLVVQNGERRHYQDGRLVRVD